MYGSDAAADTYHADRGNTAWAALSAEARRQARVRGSLYVDSQMPVLRLPGVPTDAAQTDAWPRTGASDIWGNAIASGVVPLRVEYATYEAALAEALAPGSLTPSYVAQDRVVRVKAGPTEAQFSEAVSGVDAAIPILSAVRALIEPLLLSARPLPRVFVA